MLRNPAAVLLWLCCIFIVNSYGVDISVTFEDLEMDTAFSDAVNNPLNGQHLIVLPWAVSILHYIQVIFKYRFFLLLINSFLKCYW